MLHLILGDVGSGKTTACFRIVEEKAKEGIPSFLIVPEQETVLSETLAAKCLPPERGKDFEVTNFTRLANTVFREIGGLAKQYATAADKALVMHKTLKELSPYLHQKPTRFDAGKITAQLDGIRALHLTAITREDLNLAAKSTDNQALKEKLEDLSLIYGFYKDALGQSFADGEDDITELSKCLKKQRLFRDTAFLIDSFYSFTEQQYGVIEALLPYADITVTLSLPKEAIESHEAQKVGRAAAVSNLCFAEILETYRRLHDLAKKAGVSIEYTHLGENKRQNNPVLRHIAKHLWRPDYKQITPLPKQEAKVTLFDAEDPFEAADFIAADILAKVHKEGLQFGDFAIVAGDATQYAGILDVALTRAGIPNFLSTPTNVSIYEPIKMIGAAYAAVCGGFQRKDVLAYLKCGICEITPDEIDAYELYTEAWQIEGKDLIQDKPWNMHPNGLGEKETPYSKQVLEGIEKTKEALRAQLSPLMEAAKSPISVAEHCHKLTEFLLQNQVEDKLKNRCNELMQAGEIAAATDYARLWKFICIALDSLYDTMGEDVIAADLFKELLRLTMDVSSIGRIPPARDEVTVGSASTLRTENKKHFYLFGIAEELFPGKAETSRLFSEAEAKELSAFGLNILPNMQIRLQKELFYFYRALSLPTEQATLVCFQYDAERKTCVPSDAVGRVKALAGENFQYRTPEDYGTSYFFQHPVAALARLGTTLDTIDGQVLLSWYKSHPAYEVKAQMAGKSVLCDTASLTASTCKELWGKEMPLSQSKLDTFVRCPFSYHQKYVLELNENKKAEFGNREIGTFIHGLLENFLKHHDIRKPLSDQELMDLTEAAAKKYLASITPEGYEHTAQMKHIMQRLCNATTMILRSLADEFAQSKFNPVLFELPIGKGGDPHLEKLFFKVNDDTTATLTGYIDRVDSYVKDGDIYVRVLDYKTGSKTFSQKDLDVGINLQLLLYLNALLNADGELKVMLGGSATSEILPAGVLYLSCNPKSIKSDTPMEESEIPGAFNKGMQRSGLFLADKAILEAMESDLKGRFIPVKTKKDGDFDAYSKDRVKTVEEWKDLFKELHKKVCSLSGQIYSGKADAKPLSTGHTKGICNYCSFKPQCRNATID